MRHARIKAEGAGYYHCMSRIIERRYLLGDVEKERLLNLMQRLAAFGGLQILAYCFLSNHFHVLAYVPAKQDVSDPELLRRLSYILPAWRLEQIAEQLKAYREQGLDRAAESLKARYTYRMHDISEFFKALKQRFSQYYNTREGRRGTLWEERFKSLLVEASEDALVTMAAYIDLNPVRAGLVNDPKDWRWSSYGAGTGGEAVAREGCIRLLESAGMGRLSWEKAQAVYRERLYVQGREKGLDPEGRAIRKGFKAEEVEEVLARGGRLPMEAVLRCRVRYFADGLALGSRGFLEGVFERYRGQFGKRRRDGARAMRYGEWGGLCTLRDLRVEVISRA